VDLRTGRTGGEAIEPVDQRIMSYEDPSAVHRVSESTPTHFGLDGAGVEGYGFRGLFV
jgi:hypothetical protein